MNAVAIALVGSLLAPPAVAAPQTVYRPPITSAAELSVAVLDALGQRVDEAFARAEFESVAPSDPSVCTAPECWQQQAHEAGSRYMASFEVDAAQADHRLTMSIVDLTDGSTVVEVARTCELCGRDELLDAAADLSAAALRKLRSHTAITTAVAVDSIPTGARVVLDGEDVGTTPLQLEVSPGPHTMELSADGYDPFSQAIDIARGSTESLRLRLSAAAHPVPAPRLPDSSPTPTRRRGRVMAGAALVGGGFAVAAAGVTLLLLHGRPITSDCSGDDVDTDGDCHFLRDTRTGGIIGLSAGAAALVGGAVLLGLELRRGRPGTVALSPAPSGLLLHGRF